jgi:phosphatidate phosphatase APP1
MHETRNARVQSSRRVALQLGRILAALLPFWPPTATATEADTIVLYGAYGSGGSGVVEGRIIEGRDSPAPSASDGWGRNLLRNLGLLINSERPRRPLQVHVGEQTFDGITDAEGYFRIDVTNLAGLAQGWHPVRASSGSATGEGGLLLVPERNLHGVISDLDDTILVSSVNRKGRMLASAFLKNPLQREPVPGTARLYQSLAQRNADPATAPIFYISGSPRQFYSSIQLFLEHNVYPRGVLITKRITDDETSESLRDQVIYKADKIADILARVPGVRYTLIGDDSERDPEIYAEVRRLYPDRIDAIWIRRVNPDPDRLRLPDQGDLEVLLREQR